MTSLSTETTVPAIVNIIPNKKNIGDGKFNDKEYDLGIIWSPDPLLF